jgi:glycolate oxidase FAD binding subunit
LADGFEAIVGAEALFMPPDEWLDGVPVQLVLRPADADELAGCLAEARSSRTAVVLSCGRTKLAWGNRPDADGLVRIDLSRLDRIVELNPAEGIATVQAGVPVAELARAAEAQGVRTLLDGSHVGASVGGSIATDAYGPGVTPLRRLRNELLGLEVVLSGGQRTRAGGRVVKNVTGFDLVRLYCGSFGTLGALCEATLRVHPLPEALRVSSRSFATWSEALEALRDGVEGGLDPDGAGLTRRAGAIELLWRLEGGAADVAGRAGALAGERRSEELWRELDVLRTGDPSLAADPDAAKPARVRLFARPSDTRALIDAVEARAGAEALRLVLPLVGVVFCEPEEQRIDALLEAAERESWGLFVESASPAWKVSRDVFGRAPEGLGLMRGLKERFDAERVLAPGRFVGRI